MNESEAERDRLRKALEDIGHIYTLVWCGDIDQAEFFRRLEVPLRKGLYDEDPRTPA